MTPLAEVEAAALALPAADRTRLLDRLIEAEPSPVAARPNDFPTRERVRKAEGRLGASRRGETASQDWRSVIADLRNAARDRGGSDAPPEAFAEAFGRT